MKRITKAFFPVTGKNKYCGPTAVSALLGVSRDTVAMMVACGRGHSKGHLIRGMHLSEMHRILQQLSPEEPVTEYYARDSRQRLRDWRSSRDVEAMFDKGWGAVVCVTNHYIAMKKQLVMCSWHPEPVHHLSGRHNGRKVIKVFWIPACVST